MVWIQLSICRHSTKNNKSRWSLDVYGVRRYDIMYGLAFDEKHIDSSID